EEPARLIGAEEAADLKAAGVSRDPVCSVSGETATSLSAETLVEVGNEIWTLCHVDHFPALNEKLVKAASGGTISAYGNITASFVTTGPKSIVIVRVDFSDLAGAPFSENTATN